MKKILIANIFGIGDVLFTMPILENIKLKFSNNIKIDYICNKRVKNVLKCNKNINKIIVYEKDDYTELYKKSKILFLKKVIKFFNIIKKNKYDIVFDFTLNRNFGLLFKLCNILKRIGLNYKNRGIFLTHSLEFIGFKRKHVVETYLDLLKILNIPILNKKINITPDKESLNKIRLYLKNNNVNISCFVIIVPGGGASWGKNAYKKQWCKEKFAIVADKLINNNIDIVIVGDALEVKLCEKVKSLMKNKPKIIINNLDIKDYISLLSISKLVLCNDGGSLHLSVALGVKTISIFGPVDHKIYGPYPISDNNKVIINKNISCRPCYNNFKINECNYNMECFKGITSNLVINECLNILKQ